MPKKSVQRLCATILILLFLLLLLSVFSLSHDFEVGAIPDKASCHIDVLSINPSSRTLKLHFVFYETTGSGDFRERSTSWLIFNQYGYEGAIVIGVADPEWTLIGTNNVTLWSWKLEKTLYLQYNISEGSLYPYEEFKVGFFLVSDTFRYFSVDGLSYYDASLPNDDIEVTKDQLPSNFQFSDLSENMKVELSLSPDGVVKFIAVMIYIIYGILFFLLGLQFLRRKRIALSDSIALASGVFVFLPILIFTFRTSIAPVYLTFVDSVGFLLILCYGVFLCIELFLKTRKRKLFEPVT